MHKRAYVLACVAVLLAAVACVPAVAMANPANDSCIVCHAPGGAATNQPVFRDVGVDYGKCAACHKVGLYDVGRPATYDGFWHGHPADKGSMQCGGCHKGLDAVADPSRMPNTYVPALGGYFNTSTPSTAAPSIHQVHSMGSWPGTNSATWAYCKSCHLAPSCTGCHYAPDQVTHTDHAIAPGSGSTTIAAPVPYIIGTGAPLDFAYYVNTTIELSTCINDACHSLSKLGDVNTFEPTCGSCHPDKLVNHGGTHNLKLPDADYNNTTVSGCTNSGAGCHGAAPAGSNYATPYHPNSGCITGLCHTSPSKLNGSHTNPLACQDCHDGTFTSAPLVTTLTSSGTGGHYSETSHTAAPSDLTGTMSSGGTVSATCTNCHANVPATGLKQLYAQHQGLPGAMANTTCSDCHNYSSGVSAVVTSGWTAKKCSDCHNGTAMPGLVQHATTAPVTLGTSADGCGASGTGCHTTYDLHALHKGTAGGVVTSCELVGCHEYTKQGLKPTSKTCGTGGTCHTDKTPLDPNHFPTTNHTAAPFTPAAQGATFQYGSKECTTCHSAILDDAHSHTSTNGGSVTCTECHSDTTLNSVATVADKWSSKKCIQCHNYPTDPAKKTHATYGTVHVVGTTRGCAGSGTGCHNYTDLALLHDKSQSGGAFTQHTCYNVGCHTTKDTRPAAIIPFDSCGQGSTGCHTDKTTANHGYEAPTHAATATVSVPCMGSGCHVTDLKAQHDPYVAEFGYSSACQFCHTPINGGPTKAQSVTPWNGSCQACHPNVIGTDHKAQHEASPTISSGQYGSGCAECHQNNLMDQHAGHIGANGQPLTCDVCHSPTAPSNVRAAIAAGNTACTACHTMHVNVISIHESTTTANGTPCGGCHYSNLGSEHQARSVECLDCHDSTSTVVQGAITSGRTDCGACHAAYHTQQNAKHASLETSCSGAGCHVTSDVSVPHAPSLMKCLTCHDQTGWVETALAPTPTTWCSTCHLTEMPGNHGGTHNLNVAGSNYNNATVAGCTNSGAGCHGAESRPASSTTGAIANYENPYHPNSGCITGLCHTDASKATHHNPLACQDCHDGTYTSADSVKNLTALAGSGGHYSETSHTAAPSDLTGTMSSGGTVNAKCTDCHGNTLTTGLKQLYFQHQALPTLGNTTCFECHNFNTAVSAVVTSGWTTKKCADCHKSTVMPTAVQHATTAPVTLGTSADGCGASGTGCHSTYDLHALHKGTAGGVVTSCALAGCHDYTKQGLKPTSKSCGTGGDCHTAADPHDPAQHIASDASSTVGCYCHVTETTPTVPVPEIDNRLVHKDSSKGACAVCHSNPAIPDITTKTAACKSCHNGTSGNHHAMHESTRTIIPGGCEGCHYSFTDDEHLARIDKSTGQFYTCDACHKSTDPRVVNAIATNDNECYACHAQVTHYNTWNKEFIASNASLHRVNASLPGMRYSWVINGTTYTMAAPSTLWKSGYTANTIVPCDSCHSYDTNLYQGPHGSSVNINMDPAWPGSWKTARLSNGNISPANTICSKCHVFSSSTNRVHGEEDHNGEYCISCHTQLPHGWNLPRLLAYTTDPAPYRSTKLRGLKLKNYTTGGWQESDCAASCEEHGSSVSPLWPSAPATQQVSTGHASGTVKSSTGASLAGAEVVTEYGQSTLSTAGGVWKLAQIPTGAYRIIASMVGYYPLSKTVTISQNQTTTNVSFVLTSAPTGTLQGYVKTSTGTPIEGASVSSSGGGKTRITDANGFFSFGLVAVQAYTLTASRVGYTTTPQQVTVTANLTTTANLVVQIAGTGKISGRVLNGQSHDQHEDDDDHQEYGGLAYATVTTDKGQSATTDANGYYVFQGLSSGTYVVTVTKPGWVTQARTATITGSQTAACNFTMQPTPRGSLRGAVRNSAGYTLHDVSVRVVARTDTTDWYGRYYFSLLDQSTYVVVASGSGFAAQAKTVNVTGGYVSHLDFAMTPGTSGAIMGCATDAAGNAVSGVTVTAGSGSAVTGSGGYYAITGLAAGTYTVTFTKAGYGTVAKSGITFATSGVGLADAQMSGAPTAGTLAGVVTDSASGAKLSGATVSVAGGGSATTDSNGNYAIAQVAPGTPSVTYSKTGYTTQPLSVTIAAGSTTTKNVALVPIATYRNLAPGKTATASSARSGYAAGLAFDGSTSTRWYSSSGGTQWLRVDLGSAYAVDKVVIPWYSSYYARSYQVQYSTTGSSWTNAYSTTYGTSGTKTHTFTAKTARYWRIYCTRSYSSSGYSITDCQVWGK